MPRTFYINGESLVAINGPAGSLLAGGSQLGLAVEAIEVMLTIHSIPLTVDAFGGKKTPIDEQVFGGEATIRMSLVHFNPTSLAECVRLSFPGSGTEGSFGRAGTRRGGAIPFGTLGNNFIALTINSPVQGLPYTFPTAYLKDEPYRIPLGTEKSIVMLTWKALAYQIDPWGNGTGSLGAVLYNRTPLIPADQP